MDMADLLTEANVTTNVTFDSEVPLYQVLQKNTVNKNYFILKSQSTLIITDNFELNFTWFSI